MGTQMRSSEEVGRDGAVVGGKAAESTRSASTSWLASFEWAVIDQQLSACTQC